MTTTLTRPVADRLLDARILHLAGEVSDETAHRLITELLVLSADDPDSDICLSVGLPAADASSARRSRPRIAWPSPLRRTIDPTRRAVAPAIVEVPIG